MRVQTPFIFLFKFIVLTRTALGNALLKHGVIRSPGEMITIGGYLGPGQQGRYGGA